MRQRRAEERHDGVADELLDGAAEPLQLGLHPGVVGREHPADVLGVELLGAAGEADEVGEQHGDDLALLEDGRLGLAGRHEGRASQAVQKGRPSAADLAAAPASAPGSRSRSCRRDI